MMAGIICFVGVGSNMNEPAAQCLQAINRIAATNGVNFLRRSSLYKTEPVGTTDQDWFINTVAEIRTMLTPHALFKALQIIENDMGRIRDKKWESRIIDLDILLYGQDIIKDEELVIPHPELHRRRFVLVPLCEIAAYVIHPAFGISMRGLMERLEDEKIVNLYQKIEA